MQDRINKVRTLLEERNLDGLLITNPFNRRYISGFTGTAGSVLITANEAFFITDFRYTDQAKQETEGYTIVQAERQPVNTWVELIKQHKIKVLGFEQDHVTVGQYTAWKEAFAQASCRLEPTSGLVERLRLIKDEKEIKLIKEAVRIADETFAHILTVIKPGLTERAIAHEIEMTMRQMGAASSSFDIIVASGVRSALPHGVASDKVIENGELVTLDFGAVYKGYVSDLTRTIAIGKPDPKLKEIYEICLEAQKHGVAHVKAGMTGREADALCREVIKSKGYGPQFGHSTGHGIGLEIHEGPTLSMRSDVLLQAGMVVTVEPGIYITGLGGVRIEDDVLIKESGAEILTQSPKELLIID